MKLRKRAFCGAWLPTRAQEPSTSHGSTLTFFLPPCSPLCSSSATDVFCHYALSATKRANAAAASMAAALAASRAAQHAAASQQPSAVFGRGCNEFMTSAYGAAAQQPAMAPGTPAGVVPQTACPSPSSSSRASCAPPLSALLASRRPGTLGRRLSIVLPQRYTNIGPDDEEISCVEHIVVYDNGDVMACSEEEENMDDDAMWMSSAASPADVTDEPEAATLERAASSTAAALSHHWCPTTACQSGAAQAAPGTGRGLRRPRSPSPSPEEVAAAACRVAPVPPARSSFPGSGAVESLLRSTVAGVLGCSALWSAAPLAMS